MSSFMPSVMPHPERLALNLQRMRRLLAATSSWAPIGLVAGLLHGILEVAFLGVLMLLLNRADLVGDGFLAVLPASWRPVLGSLSLGTVLVWALAILLVKLVCQYAHATAHETIQRQGARHLARKILDAILSLPAHRSREVERETLHQMVLGDAGRCSGMFALVYALGVRGLMAAILLGAVVALSPGLGLVSLILVSGVLWLNRARFHRIRVLQARAIEEQERLVGALLQTAEGFDVLKLQGAEDWARSRVLRAHGDFMEVARKSHQTHLLSGLASEAASSVSLAALACLGYLASFLPAETLVVAVLATQRLHSHLIGCQHIVLAMSENLVPWCRVHEFLERREAEAANAAAVDYLVALGTAEAPAGSHRGMAIRLSGVGFGYPGSGERVLDGLDLAVAPGERVLIRGVSGSGKSTLMRLLAGFEAPSEGEVLVGGEVQPAAFTRLRDDLALVTPDGYLFPGTLRENVALGSTPLPDEIAAAFELAAVEEFESYPGEDTPVRIAREDDQLSLGQRQRVLLARMILKRPRLILLDEATSNLDPALEARIHDDLARAFPGGTLVVVSHRPPPGVGFDRTYVLEDGQLRAAEERRALRRVVG